MPKHSPAVWKPAFLAVLRDTANVRAAANAAGIDRRSAYGAREKSPEFAKQWAEAIEEATDILEATARTRATSGGSDTLLIFLLKAHRPEKYREHHKHEITGPQDRPVQVDFIARIIADPDAARDAHSLLSRFAGDSGGTGVPVERGEMEPGTAPGGVE